MVFQISRFSKISSSHVSIFGLVVTLVVKMVVTNGC